MLLPPMGLRFVLAASGIERLSVQIMEELVAISERVAAVPSDKRGSWESTLLAWHEKQGWAATMQTQCSLPAMVGVDADARKAASKSSVDLKKAWDSIYSRPDLFAIFRSLSTDARSDQEKRLLSSTLARFELNGAALEGDARTSYVDLRAQIGALEGRYIQNLNEDTTSLVFSAAELEGCRPSFLSTLRREGDSYIVTMKPPDVQGVLLTAEHEETRRRVIRARDGRCSDSNGKVLKELLGVRARASRLAGASSHAELRLKGTLAGTVDRVESLLNEVLEKVRPKYDGERAELLELKRAHKERRGEPFDGKLHPWDVPFYLVALRESVGKYDEEAVKEYFPVDHVRDEIFRVYEQVLRLRIAPAEPPLPTWHDDVTSYVVKDARLPEDAEGSVLGYFYLDLYPRDGKFSHQCVVPICPSYTRANGSRQLPVAANIGNLPRTSATAPGLLYHSQVVTFFHEFGHVIHALCTRSEQSLLSWAWSAVPYPGGVEHDYLEVPSQMLENWTWDPSVLARLSKHYETGKPLDGELVARIIKARAVGEGYRYTRQATMSLIDMILHKDEGAAERADEIAAKMLNEKLIMDTVDSPLSSWYHIAQGYDAGYYGYIWSEVYSHDAFSAFDGNVFDAEKGVKYRDIMLAPGATRPGLDMVRDFLGREPNGDAFFNHL